MKADLNKSIPSENKTDKRVNDAVFNCGKVFKDWNERVREIVQAKFLGLPLSLPTGSRKHFYICASAQADVQ